MSLRKILLLLFLWACAATGFAQDIPKWKVADLTRFIEQAEKPTILNFWATFCKPCIEEIPYFQALQKKYDSAGLQLILVSLDLEEAYPAKIKAFANKQKITAPVYFLDETNADVFCPAVDENWSGAIPASLFINNKKGYRKFLEDQLSKAKLEEEIKSLLQ